MLPESIKSCVFLCVAVVFSAASAIELTAWKGERVNAFLPAGEKISSASGGFEIKVGELKSVKYRQGREWNVWTSAVDRVVWGDRRLVANERRMIQIKVPRSAKAKTYSFGDVRVKVLDRTITPVEKRQYYLDLWQHPWSVARWHKVKPFSPEHYDAMRPLWKELALLGQKVITATIVRYPWSRQCYDGYETMVRHIKNEDGTWSFDYSLFDEYVAFAKECGLGPDIACYSICPWDEGRVWWDEKGKRDCTARVKPGTPEFEAYWGPFLVDFSKHLKKKGWFKDALIALDERTPEDTRTVAAFVQKMAPGLRVSMAGNCPPSKFEGIKLDVYSQSMEHISKKYLEEAVERRAKGFKTTYYVCNSPLSPNTLIFCYPEEGYYLGLYPVTAGLDGFLRWAYNSWAANPIECSDYASLFSGDTFLVYPDSSPSIRLLMLQNGLEAAEKFQQLRSEGGRDAELDELSKLLSEKNALWKGEETFKKLRKAADDILNK